MRGIYAITNVLTDAVYYGQAVRIEERLRHHAGELRRGRHANPHLQASWDKYGSAAFRFATVRLLTEGDMTAPERGFIMGARALGLRSFNIHVAIPSNATGVKRSPETRARMSNVKLAQSAETRARISASLMGHPVTLAARAAVSAAHKGRPLSAEHRQKMSASRMGNHYALGVRHTVETRAKLAAAQRARRAREKENL